MGERTPVALLDAPASGRLAVAEAITNILAADIERLADIRLSANWMAACGEPGEDAALYATVQRGGRGAVPGARHHHSGRQGFAVDAHRVERRAAAQRSVVAPVSLIVSAFAPVADARRTLTPQLELDARRRGCWLIDLGARQEPPRRLVLAQVYERARRRGAGSRRPAAAASRCSRRCASCKDAGMLLAYHDRSDGGLFVTLLEMAFAGHCGLDVDARAMSGPALAAAVRRGARARRADSRRARARRRARSWTRHGLGALRRDIGAPRAGARRAVARGRARDATRARASTCTALERDLLSHAGAARQPGVRAARNTAAARRARSRDCMPRSASTRRRTSPRPTSRPARDPRWRCCASRASTARSRWPRCSPAPASTPYDVHMTDILSGPRASRAIPRAGGLRRLLLRRRARGRRRLGEVDPVQPVARDEFAAFFARDDTFALGICNGCQMLAALKEHHSRAREAGRASCATAPSSTRRACPGGGAALASVLLRRHGRLGAADRRWRTARDSQNSASGERRQAARAGLVGCATSTTASSPTERYPSNPNGSPAASRGCATAMAGSPP